MQYSKRTASALLILGLAGCAQPPLPSGSVAGHGTLTLSPRFQTGGYGMQAVVTPYGKADIVHLLLKLFTLSGQTESPVTVSDGSPLALDLSASELSMPITIGALRANTTYRVRAYAYKAMGTAAADLISTSDSGSYTDVTLTNNDRPTVAPFVVQLVPTPFGASTRVTLSATGSLNFASVSLSLYGPAGNSQALVATKRLLPSELPNVLTFSDLRANSTYELDAQALDASGSAITGALSSQSIAVGNDTTVATSSLMVTVPI